MFSIVFSVLVLSILILVHELGHFIIAKKIGVKVEKFSLGFGPKIFGFKRKETYYIISAIPLGGYIKMAGESASEELTGQEWEYLSKPPLKRFFVVLAGPVLNYLLAFIIFCLIFIVGNPTLTSKIGEVIDGYPAQKSGIITGDKITAIDGEKVLWWEETARFIRKKGQKPLELIIMRNDKEFRINVTPVVKETKNILGQKIEIALIGIAPSDEIVKVKHNPVTSIVLGANKLIKLTWLTYASLWNMASGGGLSAKESLTGPIGIFYITRRALEFGFIYLLQFLAVLSMSLAIFNLFPIPVLDGGHILFLILEKIKGKPVSQKIQETATQISMFLLIILMMFIFYNDFVKFGLFDKGIQWLKK